MTPDKITLEAWVKPLEPTADGDEYTIIGLHDDGGYTGATRFGLSLVATNTATDFDIKIYADHIGGSSEQVGWISSGGYGFVMDEWTHIAVSYDKDNVGSEIRVYVNSELQEELPDANGGGDLAFNGNRAVWVGNKEAPPQNGFDGKIDEARVWNMVRTEKQILDWYNQELLGSETGLSLYADFEALSAGFTESHFDLNLNVPFQSGLTDPTCYLRPMNEEQSAQNGVQFGLGFMVIVECDVDIRQGDIMVIEGIEYTIRGVVNHDRGHLTRYKRASVTKPEKQ
jgi:hypothetical protein